MELSVLTIGDRPLFERFVRVSDHELSAYAFANLFVWKDLFVIRYALIEDCLCLFFENTVGCFMPIPPLGEVRSSTVKRCFEIMRAVNPHPDICRVESVEEKDLNVWLSLGFSSFKKSEDYIVDTRQVSELKGNVWKHKRHLAGVFARRYPEVSVRSYEDGDRHAVLELYGRWMDERKKRYSDPVYQAMLEDSRCALAVALEHVRTLGMQAAVVELDQRMAAFTCGCPLTRNLFCVNYEVVDLGVKGLAQHVFKAFSSTLQSYRHLNIMDDCGLLNLKKTKESYHPVQRVPSYTVLRPS